MFSSPEISTGQLQWSKMASCNDREFGDAVKVKRHAVRLSRSTALREKLGRLNVGPDGGLMTLGAHVLVCMSEFQHSTSFSHEIRDAVSETARGNSSFPLALNHRRSCLSSSVDMSFMCRARCHTASQDSFGTGI